ncbi:albusnodin/ikarugamycin family macrolactam cyclase [Actinomadura algeriensis]|uniref:asparagine synthase (glutamine-hydrolyzing) n=1 Tax=Actinomadura algeriensis TaxID=1679523 RepID=A0ABR9JMM9_9ACTN|nr:albusnodin/ikarugamycin family macrolactam cyclase [Actinomadura algeriensis]MBE1531816.1 asparagine synthase (glutamine-hydrolyzing) [Actinomadura algeriensis]
MRWFGGFSDPSVPPSAPGAALTPWPQVPGFWGVGHWPASELRTAQSADRYVAVLGICGATAADLGRLARDGIPDDVAHRWPGGYATIEITADRSRIWTDLGGTWPLYLTRAGEGIYWASSSLALAGLTGAEPDLERLIASLLAPAVPVLLEGKSAFEGIESIPPGSRLTLSRSGAAHLQRVWSPRPRSGPAARRLSTELSSAVALRLEAVTTLTADLSGGLDSTALALLAERARKPAQRLFGVTVHPDRRVVGGDLDYARHAAESSGIEHRLMPLNPRHAPYSLLDKVPATDEPAPSTIAYARFAGQLVWMREVLATQGHITGDGGDTLLCSPPVMLAELAAAGRHRRAAIETMRWARLRRLPAGSLLTSVYRAARMNRRCALTDVANVLSGKAAHKFGHGDIGWCLIDAAPPWATADARARAASIARDRADQLPDLPVGNITAAITAEAMAEVGRTARADAQIAELLGIPLHNPFTDSRVIDGSLSVPLVDRPAPADYKPLLCQAMSGVFPASLGARTTKGDFNADHYGGMRSNLAELLDMADGLLAAAGLVKPAELRRTLTLTASGLPIPFSSVEPVITAECWLRALREAPAVSWISRTAT